MMELKLRKIGNSPSVVPPKEVLTRLQPHASGFRRKMEKVEA